MAVAAGQTQERSQRSYFLRPFVLGTHLLVYIGEMAFIEKLLRSIEYGGVRRINPERVDPPFANG